MVKPPTYEQISPWARQFSRLSIFCCSLGVANNVAMIIARPEFTKLQHIVLTLWWLPIAVANSVLSYVMLRWAMARLAAFERENPDLFE